MESNPNAICSKFEQVVFMIGVGLREKDLLYEKNPYSYLYSSVFRHGFNIFASMCTEYAEDNAPEILMQLNESRFIREFCTKEVFAWTEGWSTPIRQLIKETPAAQLGPLVVADKDLFALTEDCYQIASLAESDVVGGFQEHKVYSYLRQGTQEQYVYGRKFLIQNPLLSWDAYQEAATLRFDVSADILEQGEYQKVSQDWIAGLLNLAYEKAPTNAKVCPHCGWTMTKLRHQPRCLTKACQTALPNNYDELENIPDGTYRLNRGTMFYISASGRLELTIANKALALGCMFELWPQKDACDVLITLPSGTRLAVDAKTYSSAAFLAQDIANDTHITQVNADRYLYVIPDETEKISPGFCALCNKALSHKPKHECITLKELTKRLAVYSKETRHD